MIDFYKGNKNKYDPIKYGEGIYFTDDSIEILHDGKSYSGAKYISNIIDKTMETPNSIGGIDKGSKLEDLEGKSYNELFDQLLFPTIYPTFIDPSAKISFKNYNAIQIIGSDSPTLENFYLSYDPGKIMLGEVKQNDRAGLLDKLNSYIIVNENTTELPTKVTLGNTYYRYRAAYTEGPLPKDNKNNDYDLPLSANYVDSPDIIVNGTWPWYATTNTGGELIIQNLFTWKNADIVAGEPNGFVLSPHEKDITPQKFKIPRQIKLMQMLNTNNNRFEGVDLSLWKEEIEEVVINNNTRNYYIYTYTGENRGSVTLKIKF